MTQSSLRQNQRKLLCEFLRGFYARGWVSGTGGGICGIARPGYLLVAPTGVHKDCVSPSDLFVVKVNDGTVTRTPKNRGLRLSECSPIFCEILRTRGGGSVMHSHAPTV